MIKQILFDCGGVFVDIQFFQLMEKLTGDSAKAALFMDRLFDANGPWRLYDQGLLDQQEILHALEKWIPEIQPEVLASFITEWHRWLPTFPEMEHLIDDLHQAGLKCYLLSKFSKQFEEFEPLCPAIRHLDGKLISYRIHLIKPSREIFDYAASFFKIAPAETLFIDDTEPNITAARAAGFHAYHFQNAADLRAELRARGLLPQQNT